jgi:antitoxin PrlF
MKTVLSEKGQITIPKPLRERLGLRPGQILEFDVKNGQLILTKASGQDPVDAVYGMAKFGAFTDELMRELRGAPPKP